MQPSKSGQKACFPVRSNFFPTIVKRVQILSETGTETSAVPKDDVSQSDGVSSHSDKRPSTFR